MLDVGNLQRAMSKATRIYTRTGDQGTTGLVGGGRIRKNALRIETYGTLDELSSAIGVARAWVKNDSVSHPTLSFKDRVVASAINAAAAFGLDTVGCASTRLDANLRHTVGNSSVGGAPRVPHNINSGIAIRRSLSAVSISKSIVAPAR